MNRTIYVDNLQVEQIQRFSDEDIEVLTPKEVLAGSLDETDALIVLCELNIDNDDKPIKRTKFYGVKLVQELRREKFMGRVLFVSFMEREQLTDGKPFNSIVNTIGHSFIQLPKSPNEWLNTLNGIRILDEVEWYDIDSNYCIKEGLAQQELHQLRGLLNDASFTNDYIVKKIKQCVEQIGQLYNKDIQKVIEGLDFENIHNAITSADLFCEDLIEKNRSYINNNINETDIAPWSVLFLDDEIDNDHKLIQELEERIEKVYCVKNAEAANNLLDRNVSEGLKISLVIADYRLYIPESNSKIHQAKQGYKFLMDASNKYPYLGYVALSALTRRFLLQSFKRMGIRVDVYSKKDYLASDSTLKILIDELIEKGNDAFEGIVRIPKLSSPHWKNYESFYNFHRRSVDYVANEQYISNKSKEYCLNYKNGFTYFNLSDYTTELKGKSKIPNEPKFFKEFLEKMVCRRAILWYSREWSSEPITSPKDIIEFLQGQNYNEYMSDNTPTNQINTNLALRLTEFPWNTTIEEKEWLINQMGANRTKIEIVEKSENEILTFVEQKLLVLNTKQKCIPNTFVNAKFWLTEALNNLPEKSNCEELLKMVVEINNKLLKVINQVNSAPSLIQILQDKDLRASAQNKAVLFQYKSLIDFYNYLKRLKKLISNFITAQITESKIDNIESIKISLLTKANKEFKLEGGAKIELDASVLFFIAELQSSNMSYSNISSYYKAFKEYFKKYKISLNPFNNTVSFDKVGFALTDKDDLYNVDENYL